MEEGKRIIHYLINYPHYAEGKSEQGQHGGFWQPQGAALLGWMEKQPCSAQPLPAKPQTQRNGENVWQSRVQNSSPSSATSTYPSSPGKGLIWPHFSLFFSYFPTSFYPGVGNNPKHWSGYGFPAPPSPKRCCRQTHTPRAHPSLSHTSSLGSM